MKVEIIVTTQGDESVGIFGLNHSFELDWPSLNDETTFPDERERVRTVFREAYSELCDETACVRFGDECPDCFQRVPNHVGGCPSVPLYILRVIKADETEDIHELDQHPSLEELQDLVGGWIELHKVPFQADIQRDMLVDEDGPPKELPTNKKATKLAGFPVVGTAIFYEKGEFN